MRFLTLWWQNGSFQTLHTVSFQIGLFSDPHLFGYKSWAVMERVLPQVKAVGMGFLRIFHGMPFRDNLRSWEICESLHVEPLLQIERSRLRWFDHLTRMLQERLTRRDLLSTPTAKRPRGRPRTRCHPWPHIRPCLVPSRCGASKTIKDCWKPWGTSNPPRAAEPERRPSPEE